MRLASTITIQNSNQIFKIVCLFAIIGFIAHSCQTHRFRSSYRNVNELLYDTVDSTAKPYLKAHMGNGDVCIFLGNWEVNPNNNHVEGYGTRYDMHRREAYEGNMSLPVDSILIFETNKQLTGTEGGRIAALSILAGLDLALAVACLTTPKACFGSCPTFYMGDETDNIHYADAEGFSKAILPSLMYADIDALNNPSIQEGRFSIMMKNEALETHCVNELKLLAYPRKPGKQVLHSTDDRFFVCENHYTIQQARDEQNDITELLKETDRKERVSLADERDLNTDEEIIIDFQHVNDPKNLGLILNFRQSLMTTYLIYNAMDYMGNKVSDFMAQIERDANINNQLAQGLNEELGSIEVYSWDSTEDKWIYQGDFHEAGPIAFNKQLLPLKNRMNSTKPKIKLVMNKGLWYIDYLALTNISKSVDPIEIRPDEVVHGNERDTEVMAQINHADEYLTTMPGSAYTFHFTLPETQQDYDLFLYSKGYYLEWMRAQWMEDSDLPKLRQLLEKPSQYLKEETQAYKQYEKNMNQVFWNSRIETTNP